VERREQEVFEHRDVALGDHGWVDRDRLELELPRDPDPDRATTCRSLEDVRLRFLRGLHHSLLELLRLAEERPEVGEVTAHRRSPPPHRGTPATGAR
jgi:hypothetical protein